MKAITIPAYPYGTINTVEANLIPRGALANSINIISAGKLLELRRGYKILGVKQNGAGITKGIKCVKDRFSNEHLFLKRGQKLLHYDSATSDFIECGADIFGSAGETELMFVGVYNFLAGDQVWFGTPSTGPFKVMMANPYSVVNNYLSTKNYHGYLQIDRSRMTLWGSKENPNNPRDSWIDARAYTVVTSEAIGSSGSQDYSGTLAFKGGNTRATCFAIVIRDTVGGETFTDSYSGTLTGSAGGTGTINYATGVYTIHFNAVTTGSVTADYQWEDSTNNGIADFSYNASSRVVGTGNLYLQPQGGPLQNIGYYNGVRYCMHKTETYELNVAADDSTYTNLVYREKVGIPYPLAMIATGDGIYYIDERNTADPDIRILTLDARTTKVVPRSISKQRKINGVLVGLNLVNYGFEAASFDEFGTFILMYARSKQGSATGVNDTVVAYNRDNNACNELDYSVVQSCTYGGALISCDSLSQNAMTLFSGFDDDDADIHGSVDFNIDNLDASGRKRLKKIILKGLVQVDQQARLFVSVDRGEFVEIPGDSDGNPFIMGTGNYVDVGNPQTVGNNTLGQNTLGGGDAVTANYYERELKIKQDKFNTIQIRVVPQGIGYFAISSHVFYDIRYKDSKIAKKYRN